MNQMTGYGTDKAWADRWIEPQMKIINPIVNLYFPRRTEVSSWELDAHHAIDLVVAREKKLDIDIGLRVRGAGWPLNEFTLRFSRPEGTKTEFAKIMAGNGRWFAYFHSDRPEKLLPHWVILDLNVIRRNPDIRGRRMWNRDRSSSFYVFDIKKFPFTLLIAASDSVLEKLPPAYERVMNHRQRSARP